MARPPKSDNPSSRKRRSTIPRRNRDYKAEYQARKNNPAKQHLPLAVRRGHPRAGERPKPPGLQLIDPKRAEERAIRAIARGSALRAAAKSAGLPEERLRRYLKESTRARRVGRRWDITDTRPRQFPFYTKGRMVSPWLSPEEASRAAKYMQAVQAFLPEGEGALLSAFADQTVTDIYGQRYWFEVDPNEIYIRDQTGELDFPEIYKIVSEN